MQNNNGAADNHNDEQRNNNDEDSTFASQNQMNTEPTTDTTTTTEEAAPSMKETATTNTETVATENSAEPVVGSAQVSADEHPSKQLIVDMTCKRHQKIYLLKNVVGMKGSHIAKLLGTNAGHVGNVLKDYKDNPEKGKKAIELFEAAANPPQQINRPDPAASTDEAKEEATPGTDAAQGSESNTTPDPAEENADGK